RCGLRGSVPTVLRCRHVRAKTVGSAHGAIHACTQVRVLLEERARGLATLADALPAEREPRAGLLDDALLGAEVHEVPFVGDALAVDDVELRLAERRRELVLHDLHARAIPDRRGAVLQRADAPDVQAHGGVELQRVPTRGGLRITEHHADLHADL